MSLKDRDVGAENRFKLKVIHQEGCWSWIGAKDKRGYARLRVNGKKTLIHRFSYMIHIGPIPDGLFVCHKCDNPECSNPDHLFLGNNADNMKDMALKGRGRSGAKKYWSENNTGQRKGERNPASKLTDTQVQSIRSKYDLGYTNKSQLGREFGVTSQMVGRIIRRQSRD